MSRRPSLGGFVAGPFVMGIVRQPPGGPLVEATTTWAHGLMHKGFAIRLTPWRRNWRYGYSLGGPALLLAVRS